MSPSSVLSVCSLRDRPHIGIIGAAECSPDVAALAEEVGRQVAESGAVIVCGGLSGVMEAASRGAMGVGGLVIGILPGSARCQANPCVSIAVATGLNEVRNLVIIHTADSLIAIGGSYGTLSEIGFALKAGKRVVGLQTWPVRGIVEASSPEQAVVLALSVTQD